MLLKRQAKRHLAGLLTGLLLCSGAASAQSLYGCSNIESARHPSFEGPGGVFFRLDPDLLSYNRMEDAEVAAVSALSEALAERGTKLIFIPLPTKALAMPNHLGPGAVKYGYHPDIAAAIFDDAIARLEKAGVATLNAREVFASLADDLPFFESDPRLTQAGTNALAEAVAATLDDLGEPLVQPVVTETMTLQSLDRQLLQMRCLAPLPEPEVELVSLTPIPDTEPQEELPRITIAGSHHATDPALFLDGYVQSRIAAEVTLLPFGDTSNIARYLTSDAFQDAPPEYLVWITPVWESLLSRGDQPMRELIAAARHECEALPVDETEGEVVRSEPLDGLNPNLSIMAETTHQWREIGFQFQFSTNRQLIRTVSRPENTPSEGRFFQPLTGLPTGPATIQVPSDPASPTKLYLCRG